MTAQRRQLVEVLFESSEHRTAEELAVQMQHRSLEMHLSTIYRNLEELERLGVVVHAHLGHGAAAYHLSEAAHSHLVCESCGQAVEAPEEIFGDLARQALDRFGFAIDARHFSVLGRCRSCAWT